MFWAPSPATAVTTDAELIAGVWEEQATHILLAQKVHLRLRVLLTGGCQIHGTLYTRGWITMEAKNARHNSTNPLHNPTTRLQSHRQDSWLRRQRNKDTGFSSNTESPCCLCPRSIRISMTAMHFQPYLCLARNEGVDPYSSPYITHDSGFHVLFHSFIPTLSPKP